MFRKPRRAYRGPRKDNSDEETVGESINPSPPRLETTNNLANSKSALSFCDDLEESDSFKVRRSAHSKRVLKQLREGKSALKPNGSSDPTFVDDEESPVKANLPDRIVSFPSKINEIPLSKPRDNRDDDYDNLDDGTIKLKPLTRSSSDHFSSMLKQGVIPDANAIHMARKQRQQAKFQLDAEEENSPPLPGPSCNDGRRLIREEDEDDDDDEDGFGGDDGDTKVYQQKRPAFTLTAEYRDPNSRRRVDISRGLQRKSQRDQETEKEMRSIIDAAEAKRTDGAGGGGGGGGEDQGGDGEEEDESETAWERQQIRKAVSHKNSVVLEALAPSPPPRYQETDSIGSRAGRRITDFGDVTLESVKATLKQRYDKKRQVLEESMSQLEAAKSELSSCRTATTEARANLPELAKALAFYMDFREFVRDVVACFNEKMPKMEYLEKRAIMLYRERTDVLMNRRRADVRDLADEAAYGPTGRPDGASDDPKQEEARRRRRGEREARRVRRQLQRQTDETRDSQVEAIVGTTSPPPYDGVSSDEEEARASVVKREAGFSDIVNDASHLFDDVVEEFCTIPSILKRFADWRTTLPNSYAQAFVAMCIPQLIGPLIRLQILKWNPLEPNSQFFDEFPWFGYLLDYFGSFQETGKKDTELYAEMAHSTDHELSVIPVAVEKVVIPRLTEILDASWDPMSRQQTVRLVKLLRTFAALWPTVSADSKATRALFEAALRRMEKTIQDDIFIPLYSKMIMADLQGPGRMFFNRQVNIAMKLLSNLLQWSDLLAPAALKHLIFTCLINRYILIGLASIMSTVGAVDGDLAPWEEVIGRLNAIVTQLPSDWLANGSGDDKVAQLRRFVDQLVDKVTTGSAPSGACVFTKEEVQMRPIVKKLKQLQCQMHG